MAFWVQLLIGIALNVVAYVLMPKPKQPKPPQASDFDDPTADRGRPVPVPFGTVKVKGVNILWYGDKEVKLKDL